MAIWSPLQFAGFNSMFFLQTTPNILVDGERHAAKLGTCEYYVNRSLEPKFMLFDCAIILLRREIIIWHKTNTLVAHVNYELKGRQKFKSFFKFLILLT